MQERGRLTKCLTLAFNLQELKKLMQAAASALKEASEPQNGLTAAAEDVVHDFAALCGQGTVSLFSEALRLDPAVMVTPC